MLSRKTKLTTSSRTKKKKAYPSKSTLKKKAWKLFSLYIRQRDADKDGYCTCVTCGKRDKWQNMQAGHGIGGRHNYILFDEEVVYAQCPTCNIFKRGEYEKFAVFLIEKFGIEWYKEKLKYKVVQFTTKDLETKITLYQSLEKIKNIK